MFISVSISTCRLLNTDALKPNSNIHSSNSFEFLDSDDVEDSAQQQEGSTTSKKKKNKKKKKKSGSATGAEGQQDDEVTADQAAGQTAASELDRPASGEGIRPLSPHAATCCASDLVLHG